MEFGDLSDNPFAVGLQAKPKRNWSSFSKTLKFLCLIVICFSLVLLVGQQSRRWLLSQLTQDLNELPVEEKRTRLAQIAELGEIGIGPLVESLNDPNIKVARTAYELLRQAQNAWTALPDDQMVEHHRTLVRALEAIAMQLPDDRTVWGSQLIQQTILATVDRRDPSFREVYAEAIRALELFSLTDRAGPSVLNAEPLDPEAPRRLVVQPEPLPVEPVDTGQWVDWPPPQSDEQTLASPNALVSDDPDSNPSISQQPTLYRSSANTVRPIEPGDPVILRSIHDDSPSQIAMGTTETNSNSQVTDPASFESIQSVTHLVQSPLQTFDDSSVMHWLGSQHPGLREQAQLELRSRGYGDREIGLATQIASADTTTRIELMESIARHETLDPRPWLLMFLSDSSRQVRLRAISILATMRDPSIDSQLRMHLTDETDPTVAHRIRRILDQR